MRQRAIWIIELLKQKNRALSYKEIYKELEDKFGIYNNDPQAAIRREIERACSDYKAYEGGQDIFYKEGSYTEAKIGLREWLENGNDKNNVLKKINTTGKEMLLSKKENRKIREVDWEKISKRMKEIGDAGEFIVLETEKEYLKSISCQNLATKVIHISKNLGDGAGYDILSFFQNGKKKHIEVKTTTISDNEPFFISNNEIQFLKEHKNQSFVYRVYIDEKRKKYNIRQYTANDVLGFYKEPVQFKVFIRQ